MNGSEIPLFTFPRPVIAGLDPAIQTAGRNGPATNCSQLSFTLNSFMPRNTRRSMNGSEIPLFTL